MHTWGVHRGSGLRIAVTGDVAPGARIAFTAPLPVAGHVVGMCEVVDVTDEPGWFGFAYATLPLHPEQGEERFDVVLADDGQVTFEITAVWRPHSAARAARAVRDHRAPPARRDAPLLRGARQAAQALGFAIGRVAEAVVVGAVLASERLRSSVRRVELSAFLVR